MGLGLARLALLLTLGFGGGCPADRPGDQHREREGLRGLTPADLAADREVRQLSAAAVGRASGLLGLMRLLTVRLTLGLGWQIGAHSA